MKDRDRFEDLFKERLHNWECDPEANLWGKIMSRLPAVPSPSRLHTFASPIAAGIVLLLLFGGCLFLFHFVSSNLTPVKKEGEVNYTPKIKPAGEKIEQFIKREEIPLLKTQDYSIENRNLMTENFSAVSLKSYRSVYKVQQPALIPVSGLTQYPPKLPSLSPDIKLFTIKKKRRNIPLSNRKWRFGIGGNNLNLASVSNTNSEVINTKFNPGISFQPDPSFPHPFPPVFPEQASHPKPVKIKHRYPFQFGLSVSRQLSKRWNFNTGITYSYLQNKIYYQDASYNIKQQLHWMGIPVSFSYRLAFWKRPYFYFTLGATGEINIAAKTHFKYKNSSQSIHGIFWKGYTHIGLSYPLLRYFSIYTEGGITYYFDKGKYEFLRSEHAFNVTGQIGFRFNF